MHSLVTIDPRGAAELDDAVSAVRSGEGFQAEIAIAAPTLRVPKDSPVDVEAMRHAQTIYVRNRAVRRMMPRDVEAAASLQRRSPRQAMVTTIDLDENLRPVQTRLRLAMVSIDERLNYEEIPNVIRAKELPQAKMLETAAQLARGLFQARSMRGALAVLSVDRIMLTNEEGRILRFATRDELEGYLIVQELMVLANQAIARWAAEKGVPLLFRNHRPTLAAGSLQSLATAIETAALGDEAALDIEDERLAVVLGRAQYGATAEGHFALGLPLYTHATSPLRRYADLANQRQLLAAIEGTPLPYSQDELVALATQLNETIERRRLERKEGFKATIEATALNALETGRLQRLADHELSQAVKLAASTGALPDHLVDELLRRIKEGTLTDTISDRLVQEARHVLPERLKVAYVSWIAQEPFRSMHFVTHGVQVGTLRSFEMSSQPAGTGFKANASVVDVRADTALNAEAVAVRKKDAEQRTVVLLLSQFLGTEPPQIAEKKPTEPDKVEREAAPADMPPNPKGALLELIQARRWAATVSFDNSQKGPPHAPTFASKAEVAIGEKTYEAVCKGAASRKDAEAMAAWALLKQLKDVAAEAKSSAAPSPGLLSLKKPALEGTPNWVGKLQEWAQREKKRLPVYETIAVSIHPPEFACTVTTDSDGKAQFTGRGPTKADARQSAAQAALLGIFARKVKATGSGTRT